MDIWAGGGSGEAAVVKPAVGKVAAAGEQQDRRSYTGVVGEGEGLCSWAGISRG
jgi:hypothetical protein